MGLSGVASCCATVRKETCLFTVPAGSHGECTCGDSPTHAERAVTDGVMGQAIMCWAPHTTTNGQWIANKVLQGFFGAPFESLCELSISDVVIMSLNGLISSPLTYLCRQYFTHERGTYLGIYALTLAGSNFFAPVIAGFINDGQGWQWVLVSDDPDFFSPDPGFWSFSSGR